MLTFERNLLLIHHSPVHEDAETQETEVKADAKRGHDRQGVFSDTGKHQEFIIDLSAVSLSVS